MNYLRRGFVKDSSTLEEVDERVCVKSRVYIRPNAEMPEFRRRKYENIVDVVAIVQSIGKDEICVVRLPDGIKVPFISYTESDNSEFINIHKCHLRFVCATTQ